MLPGQEAASVDHRSLPDQGWSLIWINAILMIPLIFGVMFLGLLPFILVALTTATVIGWMLFARGRRT